MCIGNKVKEKAKEKAREKAKELAVHFRVIRAKFLSAEKNNSAISHILNLQETNLLLNLGTEGPMTMSEIAAALQLSLSSVTTVVDKVEGKSLAVRHRSDEDRRVVRVELTAKGREFCNLVEEEHMDLTRGILDILDQREQDTLLQLFRKVTAKMDRGESPA